MGYADSLSKKIENITIDLLAENGSFSAAEVFDGIFHGNRALKRALSRMSSLFSEYQVALAYEQYVMMRVRKWIGRKDKNGNRIFIGIPVNGTINGGVRYYMRMDASINQLEATGLAKAELAKAVSNSALRDFQTAKLLVEYDYATLREGDDLDPGVANKITITCRAR